MKKSVITQNNDECYICGRPSECIHHIYEGTGRRKISDREGFVVPLCNRCHNMSDNSVHFNKELDLMLKRECQVEYEKAHTRKEFIRLIGRNYLDD